jgi:ATP-dependent 26S proteasome regulatory subunit
MEERPIHVERAQNLWEGTVSKMAPLERATALEPAPQVTSERIGGLAQAQEEVFTYACSLTNPDVYAHWGTFPPTGLLLIGPPGCGKKLLAEGLATRAGTGFLHVQVPRLAIEIMHYGGKVSELLEVWSGALAEMPPLTVFFEELEFSQAKEIGARRTDLPVGPIMDFLQELVDRAVRVGKNLAVASTSYPDTLRPAFVARGRFERIVEVVPSFPGDFVAALQIHAREAEKRAGRALFEDVDWERVVRQNREAPVGDWVRILHGTLRRKARCEAALEPATLVRTEDLLAEVERFRHASERLPRLGTGVYV